MTVVCFRTLDRFNGSKAHSLTLFVTWIRRTFRSRFRVPDIVN